MVKLVLVTHGKTASGLMDTLSMFIGDVNDVIICSLGDNGHEQFKLELKSHLKKYNEQEMLILTDICGGSPFQICLQLKLEMQLKAEIISGVNIPMLLEVYLNKNLSLDELSHKALISGQKGITRAKFEVNKLEEDE